MDDIKHQNVGSFIVSLSITKIFFHPSRSLFSALLSCARLVVIALPAVGRTGLSQQAGLEVGKSDL
jgi:hypothetical protein